MAKIVHQDADQLVVTAYPLGISLVAGGFLAAFWLAVWLGDQRPDLASYLIFNGVCGVVLAIQKHRHVIFDRAAGEVVIHTRRLGLTHHEQRLPLNKIDRIEMSYGRGGATARGGAVHLIVEGQSVPIIDSDIRPGHARHNRQLRDEIAAWLSR